jgi:hypothetical protein
MRQPIFEPFDHLGARAPSHGPAQRIAAENDGWLGAHHAAERGALGAATERNQKAGGGSVGIGERHGLRRIAVPNRDEKRDAKPAID